MTNIVHGPGSGGTRRQSRLLLSVVLMALIVGTCGSPTPTPPRTATTQASNAPSSSPDSGPISAPTPTPTPPPIGDWANLDLPKLKPVASLTPTKKGQAGAAIDTAFRLVSLDGTAPATLAARLEVTPSITLARADGGNGTVTLTPTKPLTPGRTYRFAMRRPDGTIEGAWAITAAKTLQVVGTLPENESSDVPRNTGIEFTFDQPGVTAGAVNKAFTISPDAHGRFEVHGKTVAFVPSTRLKAFTLYTVTLHKGVPLPGTGQKLDRDVVVRFETRGARRQRPAPGHPRPHGRHGRGLRPDDRGVLPVRRRRGVTHPDDAAAHHPPTREPQGGDGGLPPPRRRTRMGPLRQGADRDRGAAARPDRHGRRPSLPGATTRTNSARGSRSRRPCRPAGTSPP